MIRFLLYRPIAVLITTLALVILGLVVFRQIPVSLLPDIEVPEITVQVSYPSATARELQQTIVKTLRNQLQQVNHLADLEASTQDGLALLKLRFDYGTNVHLAYIETNEKIDASLGALPKDLERPRVLKANAGDIPVFNLNVSPQTPKNDFLEISEFCENVIRRRIEQLPEVALVDITGLARPEMVIIPDRAKTLSLGISEQYLAEVLRQNNFDLGNVTVKDGFYQYSIRFASALRTKQDVENIYFRTSAKADARLLQLKDIASVTLREQKQKGLYTFNGKRAICLSIIKQSDAQLLELRKKLTSLTSELQKDYPELQFSTSQDQTELLEISINNLISNLVTGALMTFVMIFFFLNDRKIPFLIGIVIPVSLTITFLGFYLLGLSINIVSLAGLVLGMGEIIDSAIIIVENIEDYRAKGHKLDAACEEGASEVIGPLFTSIMTNSAVFLPLLFLSGIAGALFFDQAVSVSLALGVSLLCSYTLVPVLYRLVFAKSEQLKGYVHRPPTWLARKAEHIYDWLLTTAFRYKKSYLFALFILLFLGGFCFMNITKQGMPTVSQTELQAHIDWNESVSVEENTNRLNKLLVNIKTKVGYVSGFVGQQQFLLNRDLQQNFNEATLSIKIDNNADFNSLQNEIKSKVIAKFPKAQIQFSAAKNVFQQLFNSTEPALQLRVSSQQSQAIVPIIEAEQLRNTLTNNNLKTEPIALQKQYQINILHDRLLFYDVNLERLYDVLKTIFSENNLGTLKAEQKYVPIVLGGLSENTETLLQSSVVMNNKNQYIPVRELITTQNTTDYKTLLSGKEGNYVAFDFAKMSENLQNKISNLIPKNSYVVAFSGSTFRNQKMIEELGWVILVAVALLFFILTAQFESLTQPLIVMVTILFGIMGAICFLYFANNSLNVMSAIGMVVLLGILDNDSILKIDTMNRTRAELGLMEAIKDSGRRRLKSQLMTFLTTILGVLPVLFSGGLGSELQQPLALSIIGGMTAGLLISLTLIPLLYFWTMKK